MKSTRRCFAVLFLTSTLAALTFTGRAQKPPLDGHYLALVGTYTNKTSSKGIYAFDFDSSTGKLTPKGLAAETPDPSWVVVHPNGKFAYAANESGKRSTITAFAIDTHSAKLTQLNQLPSHGEDPCYLSFDKTGKFLFVANYSSGTVAVFPILPDGKLGEHTALVKDTGPLGPNKARQEGPHAHWVEPDAGNHTVFVADLGLDSILTYGFDPNTGKLDAPPPFAGSFSKITLPPGTGPRHALLFRDSLWVLGELRSTVTSCLPSAIHWFQCAWTVSTLPPDFKGRNDAAEIASNPRGTWLYTSNRGHDSIAVLDVRYEPPRLVTTVSTAGKEPRHFAIDPTGRFLLVENQHSDSIVVFRIDPATGALSQVSQLNDVPSPVCLAFLPR